MSHEEEILRLFEEYFKNASREEIESDISFITQLGTRGVSFEDYIYSLNDATSFSLVETGVCDDIAYADLFNNSIRGVQMDDSSHVILVDVLTNIPSSIHSSYCEEDLPVTESFYAMAA